MILITIALTERTVTRIRSRVMVRCKNISCNDISSNNDHDNNTKLIIMIMALIMILIMEKIIL